MTSKKKNVFNICFIFFTKYAHINLNVPKELEHDGIQETKKALHRVNRFIFTPKGGH